MNNLRGMEINSMDGRFSADNTTHGGYITLRIGKEHCEIAWPQFKMMAEKFAEAFKASDEEAEKMRLHGSDLKGCTETGIPGDYAQGMDKVPSEERKD